MRTKPSLLLIFLLAVLLSGCKATAQPAATLPSESLKGYELYSWQEDGQWKFSLLIGTNREKSLDEIKSADTNLDGLRAALEALSAGQTITWSAKEPFSFPPQDITSQVEQICREQGLTLNLAGS